ncbi:hypothetical protein [Streptomyces sp. DW26H14]|uniref:hypothetical protein n=1 Tax=Streptomyces sp. DW26H14 TaxID=3435395 RepID=UPI00403DAFC5
MDRKSTGRRTAVFAISGVAAVGVLVGCGPQGGGNSSSAAPSNSTSASASDGGGSSSGSRQDIAAAQSAYRKTADAGSAKLTMSTTVGGVGGNAAMTLRGSGVIDLANGGSDVTMRVGGQRVQERTLDGMLYEKLPSTSKQLLPAGKTWLKLDLKKVAGALGGGSGATAGITDDPAAPFSYVKGVSGKDVTKVGTETVNSTRTTHYRLSVDAGKLAQGNAAESKQLRQQLGDRLPVDLWLDGQGRVRQEEVKATVKTGAGDSASETAPQSPPAQSPSSSQSPSGAGQSSSDAGRRVALDTKLQFSDFGTEVNVTAPPASQTADMTSKITQGATSGTASGTTSGTASGTATGATGPAA